MGMTVDGCMEKRQMVERRHRDNYVLQLQPFNLYPFSHNKASGWVCVCVSLWLGVGAFVSLPVSLRQQKQQPYHALYAWPNPNPPLPSYFYFLPICHRPPLPASTFLIVSLYNKLFSPTPRVRFHVSPGSSSVGFCRWELCVMQHNQLQRIIHSKITFPSLSIFFVYIYHVNKRFLFFSFSFFFFFWNDNFEKLHFPFLILVARRWGSPRPDASGLQQRNRTN